MRSAKAMGWGITDVAGVMIEFRENAVDAGVGP
jgi:hypothetical protein